MIKYFSILLFCLTIKAQNPFPQMQADLDGNVRFPGKWKQTNDIMVATNRLDGRVLPTGATRSRYLSDRFVEKVNVIDLNAVGDGVIDNAAAINAAIAKAFETTDTTGINNPKIIEIPSGRYNIFSGLVVPNGSKIHLRGAASGSTYIIASAPMASMITIGNSTNVFDGRFVLDGISFDMANQALIGIDAREARYWTLQNCEVRSIPTNGWGAVIGKWDVTLRNNIIDGNNVGNGILFTNFPHNSLSVLDNSIFNCFIGAKFVTSAQDVLFQGNSWDANQGTAIWFSQGVRNAYIKDTFENSGKIGVSVERSLGVFTNVNAAIVAHALYNATSQTTVDNLNIEGSTFSNVATNVIALSGATGVKIRNNYLLTGYSYSNYVNFFWEGSLYTATKANIIEYTGLGATVHHIVGLNADDKEQNHAGLQIINNNKLAYVKFPSFDKNVGNPLSWEEFGTVGTLSIGRDGYYEDVFKVWKLERSAGGNHYLFKIFTINETNSISSLNGNRYFRIQYATKGDVGAANGLRVSVFVDGVERFFSDRTAETWRASENILVEIPPGATNFQIALNPVFTTIPCWVTKFSITDASELPGNEVTLTDLDFFTQTATVPTYGTWQAGDKVYYKSVSSSGYIGAICTSFGSPGTWTEFGASKSGANFNFLTVNGRAYNSTTWNNSTNVPHEGSIRNEIESIKTQFQPLSPELTLIDTNAPGANFFYGTDGSGNKGFFSHTNNFQYVSLAMTNLTDDISTGAGHAYYIFPVNGTIRRVWGNLFDASSSGDVVFDVNIAGTTIMATDKIEIEATEFWSGDATTQPVITSSNFNAGQVITADIDSNGTDAKGPQVVIEWYPR